MNETLTETLTRVRDYFNDGLARLEKATSLFGPLNLSADAEYNFMGSDLWVTTTNREDVEKVLALAPAGAIWTKSKTGYDDTMIRYVCVIDDVCVQLHVTNGALPPTCEVREMDVDIPAQPARTERRRVLVCKGGEKQPEQVAAPEVVADEIKL